MIHYHITIVANYFYPKIESSMSLQKSQFCSLYETFTKKKKGRKKKRIVVLDLGRDGIS
jgi:hypothetical protein